jgi:tripartite-type tricarboxylate transporter receptor subunit TctC
MASPGSGSTPHVNGELFKVMTGTNIVHVPYRSAAAVMTDLLSGQVQLYFGTTASSLDYVRTRKLRALASTLGSRPDRLRRTGRAAVPERGGDHDHKRMLRLRKSHFA